MKYEYKLIHDDHQTSLVTNQDVFDAMARMGWRYVGQITRVDSHIVFEREAKVFDQNDE